MRGSTFTGSLECWRGTGDDEMPVTVAVRLLLYPVPPEEGRGFEAEVIESTADGAPFELTPEELERAVEQFTLSV